MGILEKMNPVLCEFLETFGTKILKIKSGTFVNFWKLWHGNFTKWNSELCEFLET